MARGSLTVVSGFAGAGKGTITKRLLAKYPQYCFSVSVTTRDPRPGEVDGKDYFFITEEEYTRRVENDELLEHARYVNHGYGTPRAYVEEQIAAGKDVILEIEVQGGQIVKDKRPETILTFIMTPTPEILAQRLRGRGTETEEVIRQRLARAAEETQEIGKYDAIIVNDDIDEAVETLHQTIQAFKRTPDRNVAFIEGFRTGLAGEL